MVPAMQEAQVVMTKLCLEESVAKTPGCNNQVKFPLFCQSDFEMPPKKKSFLGRKTKDSARKKRDREDEDETQTQERLEKMRASNSQTRNLETDQKKDERKTLDRERKKTRLVSMKKRDKIDQKELTQKLLVKIKVYFFSHPKMS